MRRSSSNDGMTVEPDQHLATVSWGDVIPHRSTHDGKNTMLRQCSSTRSSQLQVQLHVDQHTEEAGREREDRFTHYVA